VHADLAVRAGWQQGKRREERRPPAGLGGVLGGDVSTSVTINITGGGPGSPGPEASLADRLGRLERDIADLRRDAGHESEPFPAGGVDAFLSHFVLAFRLRRVDGRQN